MLKSVPLGSGLSVSRLCLGTMNFGQPGHGPQGDWTLDPDLAQVDLQERDRQRLVLLRLCRCLRSRRQ